MIFQWDDEKAKTNLSKHGVTFLEATRVWNDPLHDFVFDRVVEGEERWWAIGRVEPAGLLVVVHVHPDPDDDSLVRLISARRAMRHEQKRFEDGDL